jgi:hypothetical protein
MKERYVREVIEGFPYPISTVFVRLRTDECLDPGPLRLKYILATAEAISRFLGVLVLCECRDHIEQQGGILPASLSTDFVSRFGRITWGNWLHFAREGLKWLHQAGKPGLLVAKLVDFYFDRIPQESKATETLGKLLTLRNGLSHERIQAMYPHEFRALCEQAYPHLESVLQALDFLLDYELTFVSQIEVFKRRRRDPSYWHRLKRIRGNSDDFLGERSTLTIMLESNAIILMHPDSGHYLNLDPLLVYEDVAGKAPDIFFYNGMRGDAVAEYIACKHGGQFESDRCKRASEIAEEVQNLLRLFSPQAEERANAG